MSAMNKKPGTKFFDEGEITVGAGATEVLDQAVGGPDAIGCEILNIGAALTDFKIYGLFALVFTSTLRRKITMNENTITNNLTRAIGIISMLAWFSVAATGRWIGYY